MGSKSTQAQQTSSTNTQQSFVDNSDNSQVTDIWQDYSDNSRVDVFQDYSDNSRVDVFQDYSDNSRVDVFQDSSDNRDIQNEGIAAGAMVNGNMTLNVTDGGAFALADGVVMSMRDTVADALQAGVEQSYMANELSKSAIASNERTTRDALVTAENVSVRAIDRMSGVASDSIYEMRQNSRDVIDGTIVMGQDFANSTMKTTQAAINASNSAMERNAALIQTTALGGQDLMIDMVKKVLIGVAVSLGVAGVSYAAFGGRK